MARKMVKKVFIEGRRAALSVSVEFRRSVQESSMSYWPCDVEPRRGIPQRPIVTTIVTFDISPAIHDGNGEGGIRTLGSTKAPLSK
jgi:hypothetical protein